MKRFFILAFNIIGLTILIATVLSACSQDKKNKADSFNFDDISIEHHYEKGTLTSTVEYPKEYEGMDIQIDMNMPNMDHTIEDVTLRKGNQNYVATVELPMDGIWDVNYSFEKDKKTYFNSYTEIFGEVSEGQKKDYTAELLVNPDPILPNQRTEFEIKLTDKELNVIEDAEIKLEFHSDNSEINKKMEYSDKTYKTEIIFEEKGIYHLSIHINTKERDKWYEEELEIPVGVMPKLEGSDHSGHH